MDEKVIEEFQKAVVRFREIDELDEQAKELKQKTETARIEAEKKLKEAHRELIAEFSKNVGGLGFNVDLASMLKDIQQKLDGVVD